MPHSDPDLLALLALDEDAGSPDDARHLSTCPTCRETLHRLRSVVAVARDVQPADRPEDPPPHVWAGVRAELGLTGPDPLAGAPPPGAGATAPVPAGPGLPATATDLGAARPQRREWRRPALLLAAAAAGVGVGVAGTLLAVDAGREAPPETVVATTTLAPLPGWTDAAGNATVVQTASGQRLLQLELAAEATADGFREVWLIDREVSSLVSLGVLDGASGTFAIPDGVDLAAYPVVDVSLEPVDGDPTHSGDSIVRGTLGA